LSFGFLIAGFIAATNAGRIAFARESEHPSKRAVAIALLVGAVLIVVLTLAATDLLDALSISPESFRIAAGVVLLLTGARWLVWPRTAPGPFTAVLITPELAVLALSFGADEPTGKVLGAAAISLPILALAATTRVPVPTTLVTQALAALQIVIAIALTISGMRDV